MNKRIKELAAQAYTNERVSHEPKWKPNRVSEVLLADLQEVFEEFAKLIVKDFDIILANEFLDCVGTKDKKSEKRIERLRARIKTLFESE